MKSIFEKRGFATLQLCVHAFCDAPEEEAAMRDAYNSRKEGVTVSSPEGPLQEVALIGTKLAEFHMGVES